MTDQPTAASVRRYVCPECGYDKFRTGKPTGTIDFKITWYCPACATLGRGLSALVETTDPRGHWRGFP